MTNRVRSLDAAFDAFVEVQEQGEPVDAREFCKKQPLQIRARLQKRIENFLEVSKLFGEETRPAEPAQLRRVDNYDIIDHIGRGGMGDVYAARDRETGRRVALKVIRPGNSGSRMQARFDQESRVLSKLPPHRNIATLYATGKFDDKSYFAMELVKNPTQITKVCSMRTRPVTLDDKLELFLQACEGVRAAHSSLWIHCDLTPQNILVTEEPATGKLVTKIIDFGLTDYLGAPLAGRSGTIGYMSLEQREGGQANVGWDIYALGVVLCELVTGSKQLQRDKSAPSDLLHIIGRALGNTTREHRQEQYRSVDALADDIERYRSNRMLRGERGMSRALVKTFRRHRPLSIVVATSAAAMLFLAWLHYGTHTDLISASTTLRVMNEEFDKESIVLNRLTHLYSESRPQEFKRFIDSIPTDSVPISLLHQRELINMQSEDPSSAAAMLPDFAAFSRRAEAIFGSSHRETAAARTSEALAHYFAGERETSIRLLHRIAEEYADIPDSAFAAHHTAGSLHVLSARAAQDESVEHQIESLHLARASFDAALRVLPDDVQLSLTDYVIYVDRARVEARLGELEYDREDRTAARAHIQRAARLLESLTQERAAKNSMNPNAPVATVIESSAFVRNRYLGVLLQCGKLWSALGEQIRATASLDRAREHLTSVADPQYRADYLLDAAVILINLQEPRAAHEYLSKVAPESVEHEVARERIALTLREVARVAEYPLVASDEGADQ